MFLQTGLVVLIFAAIAHGDRRVMGGVDAPIHKFPYLVSLRDDIRGHFCGGSILNKRWILSAAHCVEGLNPNSFTISAGTNFLTESGTVYQPKFYVFPKEYKDHYHYDIALVRLKNDIVFTDFVKAIKLTTKDLQDYRKTAIFAGWGLTENGKVSNTLQEINLNLRAPEECRGIFETITKRHICTLNVRQGICSADSGGPLVLDKVQIGIASYGKDPCGNYPDVWTRVFSYRDWILETMEDYDSSECK